MAGEDTKEGDLGRASQLFLDHLEGTGFFQQIRDLEGNLKSIADEIKGLGATATQRLEEVESLAAHVLAVESILTVMLKSHPVDAAAVRDAVRDKTATLSGEPDGSATVHSVAADLIAKAQD